MKRRLMLAMMACVSAFAQKPDEDDKYKAGRLLEELCVLLLRTDYRAARFIAVSFYGAMGLGEPALEKMASKLDPKWREKV